MQVISKKEQLKQIVDEENLDSPQNSVEFLQYIQKHQAKTEKSRQTLHSVSKALLVVGVGALAYMGY